MDFVYNSAGIYCGHIEPSIQSNISLSKYNTNRDQTLARREAPWQSGNKIKQTVDNKPTKVLDFLLYNQVIINMDLVL